MKIVITGVAGFIGYHLCKRLLKANISVIGIDDMNSYYDIKLKDARLKRLRNIDLKENIEFQFFKENINDQNKINKIFNDNNPEIVVNLAAQAGVRYSIENPSTYIQTNLVGFSNILEACRNFPVRHFL